VPVITQVETGLAGRKSGTPHWYVVTEVDGHKVTDAGQLQVAVETKAAGVEPLI